MVLKEPFLTVSIFRWCGGLERTDFFTVSTFGGCGDLERTHFNSFYLRMVWWS